MRAARGVLLRALTLGGIGRASARPALRPVVLRTLAAAVPTAIRTAAVRTVVVRPRRVLARVLLERLVQLLLVQPRCVEGVAAPPVRQRQPRGRPHVLGQHLRTARPGGQRDGRPGHHDVRAQPVHLEGRADRGDLPQRGVGEDHPRQQLPGRDDPPGEGALLLRPPPGEAVRVGVVRQPPPHHLGPLLRLPGRGHLHREPEPVEQLRPQLALLRVHRPHQQEPRGMPDRHALPLDVRAAHRGRVQQQIDQVVPEKIHLVHIEDPAMRGGQQPRLVRLHALAERPFQIQRPREPVLGRSDRQLDQRGGPLRDRQPGGRVVRTVRALRVRCFRIAGEPAAPHHLKSRQQPGQRPHGGGLGGALLAAHEHAADGRTHRVQQQREPQIVHADHGGERIGGGHRLITPPGDSAGEGRWNGELTRRPPGRLRARDRRHAAGSGSPDPVRTTAAGRRPPGGVL